jgi:flagellar biosynthetic protein FlhB
MSGGDRTEKATPKKREDARKRGQVMKSHDLSSAVQLLAFTSLLGSLVTYMGREMQTMLSLLLSEWLPQGEPLSPLMALTLYRQAVFLLFRTLAPVLALALLLSLVTNLVQTRFLVSGQALAVKPDRINPLNGIKRLFSLRSVTELAKALLKIIVLLAAVYPMLQKNLLQMGELLVYNLPAALTGMLKPIGAAAQRCALVLLCLAVGDFAWEWWRYEKDLMMTKEEIREEIKQMEGNPQTRSRIRQIQRQLATRRMMQDVAQASVVVTNPTHIAVALRYEAGQDLAPVVVAMGRDRVAQKIREIARENRIMLVENRPLARLLLSSCEIGRAIPAELYGAVAEVLAYVTRIKEGSHQ